MSPVVFISISRKSANRFTCTPMAPVRDWIAYQMEIWKKQALIQKKNVHVLPIRWQLQRPHVKKSCFITRSITHVSSYHQVLCRFSFDKLSKDHLLQSSISLLSAPATVMLRLILALSSPISPIRAIIATDTLSLASPFIDLP